MGYSEDIINTVDADIESLEIELTDEIVKAKADYDKTLEKYKRKQKKSKIKLEKLEAYLS
ncbi:hypothetical protein H477_0169 [[Clostridium] sordellii ATCC 9714]|nr:hypothetical protein H477_0169 [[Clostridium] sordellii ATCC 9714] [Paeniclostridium sordellii ATCC 9714]